LDKYLDFTKNFYINKKITITGSKSESNRLLILKQLFENLKLENVSNAKDTKVLAEALATKEQTINIGHAGTAMRFLTAYFATKKGAEVILTGSERMQKRPIKILVEALQKLGAEITYVKEEGFPPLKIIGKDLTEDTVAIEGNVSSQYISALLLIAPSLKNGLTIELRNEITSIPYIEMTLTLLNEIGVKTAWKDNKVTVLKNEKVKDKILKIESDWSAASYYYSLVALSKNRKLSLSNFKENSLQGDRELAEIYKEFGVETTFKKETIEIKKIENFKQKKNITFDLIKTPDIAQTIAVTSFGLGVSCELTGLHTLKIKETDRLQALKNELEKFGAKVRITEDSLHLESKEVRTKSQELGSKNQEPIKIATYDDHRMAMAFAPLALKIPLLIEDSKVVEKSYPDFWKDFESIFE